MKNNVSLTGILFISLLFLLVGCDERISDTDRAGYSISGALVKNLDNDSVAVAATLKISDSLIADAILRLGPDTIKYNDTLFILSYDDADSVAAGTSRLNIADPGQLSDSFNFTVPADFIITNIALPEDRTNPGGETVPVEWQASAGSNGYAYGVVKKDSAYKIEGFSQFAATGATSVSIPPDAFRLSGDLDTGWYYIYIYAYNGSPALARNLPTDFPSGLTPNIANLNLSGNWGAIVVSRRDSIHVQTE